MECGTIEKSDKIDGMWDIEKSGETPERVDGETEASTACTVNEWRQINKESMETSIL